MPEGISGARGGVEVSRIVLKLETNFKEVLKQQIGAYDKFIREANTLTRQVGTSMNQLAKTTTQTFSAMYKGNKREVQELVSFTRNALQGVRKESIRITGYIEKQQQTLINKQRELQRLMQMRVDVGKSKMPSTAKLAFIKQIEKQLVKAEQSYNKFLDNMAIKANQVLPKMMANAVNEALNKIAQGSRAAAVTVNNVVNDMQSRFRQLHSQQQMMGKAGFAEAGTRFLKERAAQLKNLEGLLKQHVRRQEQAEQYYQKQKMLLSQQTNNALYNQQKAMTDKAAKVVKKLGSEYEFMFNKIQSFMRGQSALTGVFRKQAEQAVAGFKSTLKGLNLESMFATRWKNLENRSRLAGQKIGQAFFTSVAKGKELDASLVKKQEHLQKLLQQAKMLQATGLIDARSQIRRFESVISKIKQFRQEYMKTQKEMSSIPRVSQARYAEGGAAQAKKIAMNVRSVIAEMTKMGSVTEKNIVTVQAGLRKIERMHGQHSQKVKATYKTLRTIRDQMRRAEANAENASNSRSVMAWRAYHAQLIQIAKQLRGELKRSLFPTAPIKKFQNDTVQTLNRIRQETLKSLVPSKTIEANLKKVEMAYKKIGNRIDELSQKRMVKPEHLKQGEGFINQVGQAVKRYKDKIIELNAQLERLRRLQKAGLGGEGMSAQVARMKEQMMIMRQHVRDYEKMQNRMQRRMASAHRQSLKGSLRSSWEMVRNFRWQVAAVIYLITRAVWFVNRTIIKMLDQIGEYRKSAMSIAASIAFQMVEDTKEAFDRAYAYSRTLMNQLEMVAAETILSLEDMLMLTKTFAQAGIVPKTEEDVRRIATIGAAIKALTEGMANAGTQMKQELYAVIQGRQRATDQLAKMFQVMGINIQKLIQTGKEEGKDMITVLSDALEPFAEMNSRMKDEWEQVKNRLGVVWKVIQRIGGEDFLVGWAKDLNKMLDTFYRKTDEGFARLTEKGVQLSVWVNVILNSFKAIFEVVVAIASAIGSVLSAIGSLVTVVKSIVEDLASVNRSLEEAQTEVDGLTFLLQVVVQTLNVVAILFKLVADFAKSVAIVIGIWVKRFKLFAEMKRKFKAGDWGDIGPLWDDMVKSGEKANDDIKKIWTGEGGFFRTAWKSIDDINEQFRNFGKMQKGIWPSEAELGPLFKVPHNVSMLAEKVGKLAPKMKAITLAGLEGPEKFKKERELTLKEVNLTYEQLKENYAKIGDLVKEGIAGRIKIDPKKLVAWIKVWEGHGKSIKYISEYISAVLKKEGKQLDDWYKQQAQKMAGWKREYETFWESLTPKDLTRAQKTEKWLTNMNSKLEEMKVKNPLVRAEFEKFKKALDDAFGRRQQEDINKTTKEITKMDQQLTSHRVIDSIEKIYLEFDKIEDKIKDNINWTNIEKDARLKLLDVVKAERIEMERLNLAHKAGVAEMEVISKRAAYMMGSFSPKKQLEGEMLELKTSYRKSLMDIQKEIDKTYKEWVKDGQWASNEGAAEAKRYVEALQEQMVELTKATERELRKKQIPIWNDLVEASKGWSDGFTDALSEIVNGVDSVSEALDALQKQIIQDVLKTVIKRGITDQLMSALGSGSESPMAGFFGMFPGGKAKGGAQEITATKPIPVTIYNPGDLMESTIKTIEPMEKLPMPDEGIAGSRVFVTNWPISGAGMLGGTGEVVGEGLQGAAQDLADTSATIAENTAAAEGSTRSWYSGITDIFSSISNWFKGLFGGGAGAGGGTNWAGWAGMAMQGASYMMAEGGRITEPVVGKGLESGELYNFGERTKYGEDEIVAPMKKIQRTAPGQKVEYHMPIHISAIDTQSGIQFLTKHSDTIQNQLVKNLKKNKPIRKGIQQAY